MEYDKKETIKLIFIFLSLETFILFMFTLLLEKGMYKITN